MVAVSQTAEATGRGLDLRADGPDHRPRSGHSAATQSPELAFFSRLLGAKGIGRFAAARLASRTTLVTRRNGAEEITLRINWDDFTKGDAYLDKVPSSWSAGGPRL